MNVSRRLAIKQFLFASAGIILIPACFQDKSKASIVLAHLDIDADQEKLLAELAESIIPATKEPGAKDIGAHLFVLKMLDDCYSKEDQQKFVKGMSAFESTSKTRFNKDFAECTPEQKTELLNELEAAKGSDSDLAYFYANTKRLTIQAYTTSQYYLTNVKKYELVPGRYHGCVPVS